MLVLLGLIIVFHIITAALLFIATIDNAWWRSDMYSTDIWQTCFINNSSCSPVKVLADSSYLEAVQATMILSVILCCISFFIFLIQLFRLPKGERFLVAGSFQLLSSLCVMIAASIYTNRRENFHDFDTDSNYGYSYILAWIGFAFTLLGGVMYMVLRKRK
ncbi:epithelial membrane protein 2 [Callorhinchus milii]|uniref:Epithelial membrane protein 2 n=1 Tax=Callorhinchus milii TaxID=7868 RepID=V9KSB0_CALMI|nr:epithelial membrane protein 2 [Callorhinchus milii]|eukprot:gi/632973292/ref/XP_007903083.1/ PREDICTED: epithelial membrane protein 2 [Callorhinchus milii]